jgi:hypothetical protein
VTVLEKVIKAVTPAEAGVQKFYLPWIPAPVPDTDPGFAGMTGKVIS